MFKETNYSRPLWARLIFEAPEYIHESLLKGNFPKIRIIVITLLNKLLLYSNNRLSSPSKIWFLINYQVIKFLDWVNNNWEKKVQLKGADNR